MKLADDTKIERTVSTHFLKMNSRQLSLCVNIFMLWVWSLKLRSMFPNSSRQSLREHPTDVIWEDLTILQFLITAWTIKGLWTYHKSPVVLGLVWYTFWMVLLFAGNLVAAFWIAWDVWFTVYCTGQAIFVLVGFYWFFWRPMYWFIEECDYLKDQAHIQNITMTAVIRKQKGGREDATTKPQTCENVETQTADNNLAEYRR